MGYLRFRLVSWLPYSLFSCEFGVEVSCRLSGVNDPPPPPPPWISVIPWACVIWDPGGVLVGENCDWCSPSPCMWGLKWSDVRFVRGGAGSILIMVVPGKVWCVDGIVWFVSGSTPPNTYIVFPVVSPKPSELKYEVDGVIPPPVESPTAVKLEKEHLRFILYL